MKLPGNRFLQTLSIFLICGMVFPSIADATTYQVRKGDSLWRIANIYKITIDQLQRLNHLSGTLIYPEQRLRVSTGDFHKRAPKINTAAVNSVANTNTYKVSEGDSLWSIAGKFGLTVEQLQALNGLTGTMIKPDQVLKVKGQLPAKPVALALARPASAPVKAAPRKQVRSYALVPSRSSTSGSVEGVIETAQRYLGVKYVYGGSSPAGFDCSGFVQYVFARNGVSLPRTASEQARVGRRIGNYSALQRGDIVCFSGDHNGIVDHVGIYLGGGQFINASQTRGQVVISSYTDGFVCGVRMF